MKIAKAIPLFKKDCPVSSSTYRPISLLSVFSKIIEKLMNNRLYRFFEIYNILYSMQCGFCEKHSIDHALVSLTESIRISLDNKSFDVVFLLIYREYLILSTMKYSWIKFSIMEFGEHL